MHRAVDRGGQQGMAGGIVESSQAIVHGAAGEGSKACHHRVTIP